MPRNLNREERNQIMILHGQGRNISQIARELFITRETVRRWIEREAAEGTISDRPRARPPRVLTHERVARMVSAYQQEPFTNTSHFAREFSCSARAVRNALHRAGIHIRRPAKGIRNRAALKKATEARMKNHLNRTGVGSTSRSDAAMPGSGHTSDKSDPVAEIEPVYDDDPQDIDFYKSNSVYSDPEATAEQTALHEESEQTEVTTQQCHGDITCNLCQEEIKGFRYVCVECGDWDMCGGCEARGEHPHHLMLRVPTPRPCVEVQSIIEAIQNQLKQLEEYTAAAAAASSVVPVVPTHPQLDEDEILYDIDIKEEIVDPLDSMVAHTTYYEVQMFDVPSSSVPAAETPQKNNFDVESREYLLTSSLHPKTEPSAQNQTHSGSNAHTQYQLNSNFSKTGSAVLGVTGSKVTELEKLPPERSSSRNTVLPYNIRTRKNLLDN